MKYVANIYVGLQKGYTDPEGDTTAMALRGLGYSVTEVKTGKAYEVVFEAENVEEAEAIVEQMCKRQMSNPVKDYHSFEIKELKNIDR